MAMQEKAKKLIPGMTQLLSKRPDMFSLGVWPGYFQKAKGVEVWDLDGNSYIDMSIGGIGANILGYADPDVDSAVIEAVRNGSSSSLNCCEEIELAQLLCEVHPWAQKVRFARTGGEAMAIAVRIARAHRDKEKVAFCGYHGWHDWYLAANLRNKSALSGHLLSGLDPLGVPKCLEGTALPFRYNHIEDLKDIVSKNKNELAATIMEPIRDQQPENNFLENIRDLCDEIGAVLIIDEISAGFRINSGGAHLLLGITPDIAVFSKALGNGYPIAAVIGKDEIMNAAQNTFISSTMWTERIGPSAAIATINKHRNVDASSHLSAIGKKIQEGWTFLAEKNDLKIRVGGIFPMSHFSFECSNPLSVKALFVQIMLEKGFLASTLFYAMYAHKDYHAENYLQAVDEAFAQIASAIKMGSIDEKLKGGPSSEGFKRLT